MRSRNGNRPILLTGIALISTLAWGDGPHYYIGYRLATKNAQPVNEIFTLSKAMQPCSGTKQPEVTLGRLSDEPLERVLEREKGVFLDATMENAARIRSNATFAGTTASTTDTLTLPTRCYAVEFNDDSVTIALIKE